MSFRNHRAKVDRFLGDLKAAGFSRGEQGLLLYVLLWKLRVPIRPPHFMPGFWACFSNMVLFGVVFGGGILWVLRLAGESGSLSFPNLLFAGALMGVMGGGTVTGLQKRAALRFQLPPWREYQAE